MKQVTGKRSTLFAATLMGATVLAAAPALAGAKIDFGDGKFVTLGGGMRSAIRITEDGAPDGGTGYDADLESVRLYTGGQVTDNIGFEFNTEFDGDDDIHVLDAVAKFAFSEQFNIWAGRFLPPSDRSNLDGPYYLGTYDFPLVQGYPARFAGRDNGVAVWGQTGGGKFKYQVGAFEGCQETTGCNTGANDSDNFLYAGRMVVNLWDPEPGYYNSSDYYGAKDILAIGVVAQYQSDATGTALTPGDYFAWNVDLLMQKKLSGNGVVTLEGAYYDYDTDGQPTPLMEGQGFFVLASYLFPQKTGIGQFQPVIRYQSMDRDDGGLDVDTYEGGFNYIIDGHNARLALMYRLSDYEIGGSSSQVLLGLQLQL